ncbi:MAG: DUF4331 domain-containing protein [Trueperaceae bacterium]|nr:DUF4331 domain-containing protein [Trueperaceae bacterium]
MKVKQAKYLLVPSLLALLCLLSIMSFKFLTVKASDHDDGETDAKGRNLNLTDLYAFRESDQNASASNNDLILVMNTNPRSLPRQQYYFSTNARYEFHLSRVVDNNDMPTGSSEGILRFEFGAPDNNNQQPISLTLIRDGREDMATMTNDGKALLTTPLGHDPVIGTSTIVTPYGKDPITVFAGLREDPFFFDVEQYFRVRAGAAGIGPAVGFREPGYDFTAGYNVNAIVVRIPRKLLSNVTDTYDVWETISTKNADGTYTQVERLGRPGINEALILTNDYLNALNSVGPDFERAALLGQNPAAEIAGPIVTEAMNTLKAVGNDDERALALVKAFLPDVMRIDTGKASGYANELNAGGSPIRGRLLMDDVIDITLSVVTNGGITSDNVSYAGPNAGGTGHQALLASFPYLSAPN